MHKVFNYKIYKYTARSKSYMGLFSSNSAVTEVLSTVLLLVIATVFFASVSLITLGSMNSYFEDPEPIVTIVGFVSNDTIILEHRGGHSLHGETTEVTFSVNDEIVGQGKIKNFMDGGLTFWTISQQIKYEGEGLAEKRITVLVVDTNSGTILFDGVLRTGFEGARPYIQTLPASSFTSSSVQLHMYYDLYETTTYNHIWFEYRKQGELEWMSTNSKNLGFGTSGYYSITVENLQMYQNTYLFRACIGYTHPVYGNEIKYGENLRFTMFDSIIGRWRFNEPVGGNDAVDDSGYDNHGKIFGPTLGVEGVDDTAFKFSHHTHSVIVENSPTLQLTTELTLSTWIKPDTDMHSYYPGQLVEEKNDLVQDDFIEPSIVHVHYDSFGSKEHVYAVAYRTNDRKGYVATVCISDDGDIKHQIERIFVSDDVAEPVIVKIDADVYAIIWNADHGQNLAVTTVRISKTGDVISLLDTELFDVSGCGAKPVAKKIGSSAGSQLFLVSSSGFEVGGSLMILRIQNSGNSIGSMYTAPIYELAGCLGTDIVSVGSDVFAVVYAAQGYGGFDDDIYYGFGDIDGSIIQNPSSMIIQTFRITEFTSLQFLKEKTFDIAIASRPSIAKNTDELGVYAVAFAGLSQGVLYAVQIDSYGDISDKIHEVHVAYSFDAAPRLYYISEASGPTSLYLLTGSINGQGVVLSIYLKGLDATTAYICDISFFDYKGFTTDIIYIGKFSYASPPPRYLIVYGGNGYDVSEGFFASVRIHTFLQTKPLIVKQGSYELKATDSRVFAFLNSEQILYADINKEQWNFVVLTYAASHGWANLYVNGDWQSSYYFNELINKNNNDVRLGGVLGVMDEVYIYMQSLSENEIKNMYNMLKPSE
jgi:hypothetical protein